MTLGELLKQARGAHDLSLREVSTRAGCSAAYVQKLEADAVRTPSPRVLTGLAEALGLPYGDLMEAAGYGRPEHEPPAPAVAGAIKRYSNAHIVELLELLQEEVRAVRALLERG